MDFVQAACTSLIWITAFEVLVGHMEIKENENTAILIVDRTGGVGSIASQIARNILRLPILITTASRCETSDFRKQIGVINVVDRHMDLSTQIQTLQLNVPVK